MESLHTYHTTDPGHDAPPKLGLARGFGWFSLGLGLTELAAPRTVAKLVGIEPSIATSMVTRALGVRELVTGLGILMRPRRAVPMWARVAGDAVDLGLLAWAGATKRSSGVRVLAALAGLGAVTAIDVLASRAVTKAQEAAMDPIMFSVTINKPTHEVYAFFRDFANLPRFMDYLASVEETDDTHSHWVAKLPIGGTVSWDAEIVEDRFGELIEWKTTHATFAHQGRVMFSETPGGGLGTEVRVELELGMPGIAPSATLAKLLTKPQIKGDLRRLKQVIETGEVLFSDASTAKLKHPAQPDPEAIGHAKARAAEGHAIAPPVEPTANSQNGSLTINAIKGAVS